MRTKQKSSIFFLICFGVFFWTQSYAQLQSVTATSGTYMKGQDVAVSFTFGETITKTLEGIDFTVTQGFQQGSLLVSAINELQGLAIKIEAYPNPVTDNVNLVCGKILTGEANYSLFDINGSLISQNKLDGLTTKISFQSMVSATYILKVNQGSTTLKTFKIIKK